MLPTSHSILDDHTISWKAKAIWFYIYFRIIKEDNKFGIDEIVLHSKEGFHSVMTGIYELEGIGYIERTIQKAGTGTVWKLKGWPAK